MRNWAGLAATRENAIPAVHRRGGFHIRPVCGGAGFRGRDKSRPYGQIFRFRQTGRPQCLSRFVGEGHGPPAGVRGRVGRADMESAPTWGVCGGGNVPGFEFQRCGGLKRPPYGPRETRRPPGKMQSPRCTVGADSISARFAAAQGLREGHAPPLHAVRERPAKWDCHGRPGERRAGCPHPAGPRGGGNVPGFEFQRCGGRERPPYGPGETRRPAGKCNPRGHCKPM